MNNKKANKYILYARKSNESDDRQMASNKDQVDAMKAIAARKGFQISEIIEESKSAKKPGRPLFNGMIQKIQNGEADGILCWRLNRLARNAFDAGFISDLLQNKNIRHIQTFEKDYWPSDNVLLMLIEFGIANQFVRDLSVDVKRGLRSKAFKGCFPSLPPIGYKRIPVEERNKDGVIEIIPDPVNFEKIELIFEKLLTGSYNVAELHREAIRINLKTGNKPISYPGLRRVLSLEFYSGFYRWKDENGVYQKIAGNHKRMITQLEFQRAQTILKRNRKGRKANFQQYLFTGLFACSSCKYRLVSERKFQVKCTKCTYKFSACSRDYCPKCETKISDMNQPWTQKFVYYKCKNNRGQCDAKYINERNLECIVLNYLKSINLSERFKELISEILKAPEWKSYYQIEDSRTDVLIKTLDEKEKTKERIVDLMVDGSLQADIGNNRLQKLDSEMQNLNNEINSLMESNNNFKVDLNRQVEIATDCYEIYSNEKASEELKRSFIQQLGSNLEIDLQNGVFIGGSSHRALRRIQNENLSFFSRVELKVLLNNKALNIEKSLVFKRIKEVCAKLALLRTENLDYGKPHIKKGVQREFRTSTS